MRTLLPIICCVLVVGLFPLGSAGASWSRPAVPAAVAQTGVDVPVLSTTSCSLAVAVPLLRAFHGYFFVFRLASAGNVNLAWNLPQVQGAELALYGGYPFVDIYVPNPSLREPPAYPLLEASDVTDQLTLTSPELAPGLYTGYFYGLDDQSISGTTAQVTLLGSGCAPLARPQPTATSTPIPPTATPIGLPTAPATPPALGTPVATTTPGSGSGALLCTPAASASALSFSGSGTGSTGRFSLAPGLTTFRFTHDGTRVFSVRLINAATGQLEELLVFSLGGFAGSTAIQVRNAGEYQVNVEADGVWTAVVESPRPTTAPSAPVTLTCRGTEITPFFRLPGGPITFSYQHSGSRNFIAHLRDSTGRVEDFIANQIGVVTGTKGSSPPVGIYFAEVIADGDWTISIALGSGAGDSPTATATITPLASTTTPTAAATPSPTPTARP